MTDEANLENPPRARLLRLAIDFGFLLLLASTIGWSLNREHRRQEFDSGRALTLIANKTIDIDESYAHAPLWQKVIFVINGVNPKRDREDVNTWVRELARDTKNANLLKVIEEPLQQRSDRTFLRVCVLHGITIAIVFFGICSLFGLIRTNWPGLRFCCRVLFLSAATILGQTLIQWSFLQLGNPVHWTDWYNEDLAFGRPSRIAILLIGNCLVSPLAEEIIFRGLLYPILRRYAGVIIALFASAVIFGFSHGSGLPTVLSLTWCGFVWALGYERTSSLLPGIVSHALNNLLYSVSVVLFLR